MMYQKNIIRIKRKEKPEVKNRNKDINIANFRILVKVVIEKSQ